MRRLDPGREPEPRGLDLGARESLPGYLWDVLAGSVPLFAADLVDFQIRCPVVYDAVPKLPGLLIRRPHVSSIAGEECNVDSP